jgi:hypothetical protein
MKRRAKVVPVIGINRGPDKTKEQRILSLVPRYYHGRIYHQRGLVDLEDEYSKFPRGRYDDILDALASIEEIAFAPSARKEIEREPAPNSKDYEKWYINNINKQHTY